MLDTDDNSINTFSPDEGDTSADVNMSEFISSTVSSFLATAVTLDPYNASSISEQWENYISTISTTEVNSFDSTTSTDSTSNDYDVTDDYDDNDECIDGYKIVCYDENGHVDKNGSVATKMITNGSPFETRAPEAAVTTTAETMLTHFGNASPTTAVVHSFHSVLSPNSTANITKLDQCVPFERIKMNDTDDIPAEYRGENLTITISKRSNETQQKLRNYCWETQFGTELVKLTVLDLVFTIFTTLFMDFFRALFVRFMNRCWCWDLEKKFPKVSGFDFLLSYRYVCCVCVFVLMQNYILYTIQPRNSL